MSKYRFTLAVYAGLLVFLISHALGNPIWNDDWQNPGDSTDLAVTTFFLVHTLLRWIQVHVLYGESS